MVYKLDSKWGLPVLRKSGQNNMWITYTKTWEKISGPQHGQGMYVTNAILRLLVHAVVLCIRSDSFDNGLQATVLSQVSSTEFLFSLLTNKKAKSYFKFSGQNIIFQILASSCSSAEGYEGRNGRKPLCVRCLCFLH